MKLQKNKIVFVLVLACVVLFIIAYSLLTFGKEKEPKLNTDQIPLPDLEDSPAAYESKLEAIEALKEERETTAPPMYPEHMVDDKGYFNPDYMEYEKQRIIDSVFSNTKFDGRGADSISWEKEPEPIEGEVENRGDETLGNPGWTTIRERALAHQLFFASDPDRTKEIIAGIGGYGLLAYVDGDQTVRDGHRLDLRLEGDVRFQGNTVPKDTRVHGFVKIRPNRVIVEIVGFGRHGISLKAHDLQDGREGIYVENHMKGELVERGLDKAIGEVNLPGLPQINGLKRIFQGHNRAIKVNIKDKYQIVLKPEL